MQDQINRAKGEAAAIREVATATAAGLMAVAEAVETEGGIAAMQLRIAEDYLVRFGNLAKETNSLIVPANLTDIASMIASATKVFDATSRDGRNGKREER